MLNKKKLLEYLHQRREDRQMVERLIDSVQDEPTREALRAIMEYDEQRI